MKRIKVKRSRTKLSVISTSDVHALLGAPPLFKGEDGEAYQSLLDRIRQSVKPKDVIEEIWVRDIVDLTWDIMRLRRVKAKLMSVSSYKGLHAILGPVVGYSES